MPKKRRERRPGRPTPPPPPRHDAPPSRASRRWWLAAGGLATVVVVAVALFFLVRPGVTGWLPSAKPVGYADAQVAYIDDRACASCHEKPFREWTGSHHDRAMQPANDQTVLGDFHDAKITHFGVTSHFFQRGDKFFVETEGADGKLGDFEIKYTFGVDPLQQYLIEFPGGRLQSLTLAWDTVKKRWFSLYPDEKIPPGDSLHWTGRYQNWNMMCAECHSTALAKGYDPATDSYKTTWSALNVGCQACHGPGQKHVAWAEAAKAGKRSGKGDDGLLVNLKSIDSRGEVDNCARCHSRRSPLGARERPGRPLLDEFRIEPLRADLYHPDGQQLGEVYEYGSFRQSKMYQQGVRCSDCHNPHSGKLSEAGNALCTHCHGAPPNPRFPAAGVKVYDSPSHFFHKAGSPGAQCVNCHMPLKNYMVVHGRRDHSLRIPRPDLTVKISTPNACNACHADRSPQWAAAAIEKWYGHAAGPKPHYGETIAGARSGSPSAEADVVALASDRAQPGIVRATALGALRGPGATAAIVAATKDEDPAVRAAAATALGNVPADERITAAGPLLRDPVRSVRIAAARALATVPADRLDAATRAAQDAALAEFNQAQAAMADMPGSHLNLGAFHESQGRSDKAEQAYLMALKLDPYFGPARANLASLYNTLGRNADAERVLREGITLTPTQGELHYSLGLLLAETGRLQEAADELGEAARLLPERARVVYNYGLALQKIGRLADAEKALLKAERLNPRDPQIAYALAFLYAGQGQYPRALVYAQRSLEQSRPDDPGPRQLVEGIKQRMASPPQRSR